MASLSLTSAIRVFPCPHCGETINTTLSVCNFCGHRIDHAAAELAAAATSRISRACNDASYLRILIAAGGSFFLFRFIPVITLVGVFGFMFVEIAVPILTLRWWMKFGSIRTLDSDFQPAKRQVIFISVGYVVFVVLRLAHVLVISSF